MSILITQRFSQKKDKIYYQLAWGKMAGQRISTGIFTYTRPKDILQKNHNKESLATPELKRSKLILERQSIGTGYLPHHKIKANFLDYYEQFVKDNRTTTSRHLQCSFDQFKKFLKKDFVSPIDITEQVCRNFRSYLLGKYNGEAPANYFSEFKEVLKNAKKAGYFVENPAADVASKGMVKYYPY
jgi:Phage integrase SAM-like domain